MNEPIVFKDDITIKIDGWGTAFTVEARDFKGAQCVVTYQNACGTISAMKEPIVLESSQNHATITSNGISPTLTASMGTGGGYVPMVVTTNDISKDNRNPVDWSASRRVQRTGCI